MPYAVVTKAIRTAPNTWTRTDACFVADARPRRPFESWAAYYTAIGRELGIEGLRYTPGVAVTGAFKEATLALDANSELVLRIGNYCPQATAASIEEVMGLSAHEHLELVERRRREAAAASQGGR